jgi:hypothetical protein
MKQVFALIGLFAFVALFVMSLLIAVGTFSRPPAVAPAFQVCPCDCPECGCPCPSTCDRCTCRRKADTDSAALAAPAATNASSEQCARPEAP